MKNKRILKVVTALSLANIVNLGNRSRQSSSDYHKFLDDNKITPLVKSDADKTVDLIEFSSFSICPHCAAFHNETLKEIKESDIYKNINYYIVDFPLNQAAFYASVIANCNSETRLSYINSVYENYDLWIKSEPEELIKLLNNYGLQLGLEDQQLQLCLKNEALQNNLLSLQEAAQRNFAVNSTPTFLIDGEKFQGNLPAYKFIKIIKKKLKNK